jgi:membrane-associated phospholipid phosphatase
MISRLYRLIDKVPEFPFFIVAFFYMATVPIAVYAHVFSTAFLLLAGSLIIGMAVKLAAKTKRPQELTSCVLFKYGFPSLHAMISVGAVSFIYFISPLIALLLAPVGLLFMVSRVELHYHTRKDVWGGAAIGLVLGVITGKWFLGVYLPSAVEYVFAALFFIMPAVFSIFRVKHKI